LSNFNYYVKAGCTMPAASGDTFPAAAACAAFIGLSTAIVIHLRDSRRRVLSAASIAHPSPAAANGVSAASTAHPSDVSVKRFKVAMKGRDFDQDTASDFKFQIPRSPTGPPRTIYCEDVAAFMARFPEQFPAGMSFVCSLPDVKETAFDMPTWKKWFHETVVEVGLALNTFYTLAYMEYNALFQVLTKLAPGQMAVFYQVNSTLRNAWPLPALHHNLWLRAVEELWINADVLFPVRSGRAISRRLTPRQSASSSTCTRWAWWPRQHERSVVIQPRS
jgi:hypothetical protein